MVILQSFLGELDGATALSIGWHVSVVGQIYEQKLWSQDMLEQFAVEINNGASLIEQLVKLKWVVQQEGKTKYTCC